MEMVYNIDYIAKCNISLTVYCSCREMTKPLNDMLSTTEQNPSMLHDDREVHR